MDFNEAKKLILNSGVDLVVGVRMGDYPSPETLTPILNALKIIFDYYQNSDEIDKELACVLFGLGFHIQGEVDGALSKGICVPEQFLEQGMVSLFLRVESIFEGEWLDE